MVWVYFLGGFLLVSLGANLIGFRYWLKLWYQFDRLVNTVFAGDEDETISSRWGKAIRRGNRLAIWAAKPLFLTTHFEESIDEDVGQNAVPAAAAIVGLIWIAVALRVFVFNE